MNDEQHEQLLIAERIEQAEQDAREKGRTSAAGATEEEGLQREGG